MSASPSAPLSSPGSRPIVIDCDPGVDDAIAILLALASPELDVRGITTVAGNVGVERTSRNALQIAELAGRPDIPVFAGCHRPLVVAPIGGQFHGESGLGPLMLPEPSRQIQPPHAVSFFIEILEDALARTRPITLCTLGPMTNIAVLLRVRPDLIPGIERILSMGGAYVEAGNRTMTSEFNILADPHAASIVFSSGIAITSLALDATHQAMATPERAAAVQQGLGGPVGAAVKTLLAHWDRNDPRRYGSRGGPMHDPLVIAALLRPELFETRKARVFVEHSSALCLGQTVADWYGKSGETPNVDIVTRVDADGFFALLGERLARYGLREAS
ncbi:nucleoside hydrolase [Consotaella salsifontis]|uniref:Purine nucleosidase n=1 Tax=Consotaella salsifontis TaxID=1365950 RepID=A0A1T4SUI5_9HYPH|nr:nucleoside hydrolase [Consotaella salsifontis]SKA31935.1 purine nucleosidase [Consotaella salsifontis]